MSQDIAALGFSVDSSQVVQASHNLDGMRGSADSASRSSQLLTLQMVQQKAAAQQLSQATQALNKDFSATETALDALMRKLDDSRTLLRSFSSALPDFLQIQAQVEGVGKSFGVTSTQLESYYRLSQQLAFTTPQTVSSLARITEALANQSAVGTQVRKVLQDYGVGLQGLGVGDADKVLQQFTERLRLYADSAQKFRTAQLVLGPIDTDTFGKVSNPDYVSIDDNRRRAQTSAFTTYAGDRTRNAAIITRQTDRNDTEYADLSGHYNLGGFSFSGLNAADRAALREKAGLPAGTGRGTESEQLAMLRYLAANPGSDLSLKATDTKTELERNGGADVALTRWRTYLNSGQYSANDAEIQARYWQDRQNNGILGAVGSRIGRDARNLFGYYKPLDPPADTRLQDPLEKFLQDTTKGQTLAGFGDASILRRLQSIEALKSFAVDGSGKPNTDLSKEGLGLFKDAYDTPLYSGEGAARFAQTRAYIERQKADAAVPGAEQIDAGAEQAFYLSLPREQRGLAQSYVQFGRANRADVSQLFSRSQFDHDLLDPTTGLPNAGSPGALTPRQQQSFLVIDQQQRANTRTNSIQDTQQQLVDQQKLTEAATKGAAAIETQTVRTAAYNAALAAKRDATQAGLEADQAASVLDAKRITQATEMIANLEAENKIEADRIARVGAAGSDPVARQTEANNAQIDADYARAKRNNPQLTYADYLKQKQVSAGNSATSAANDIVAKDQQSLRIQQDLLTVAGARADVQAKFARDQQVELEFAKAIADANTSGDTAKLEAIRKQIEQTKLLRDELARVNQEAKNFQIGRDAQDGAAFDNTLAGIRDPNQRRIAALGRASYMDNRSTSGGIGIGVGAGLTSAGSMSPNDVGGSGGTSGMMTFQGTPTDINARKQMAFQYFLSRGDTPEVASGRLANLLVENPTLDPNKTGDGGWALGIGQWHPDRQMQYGPNGLTGTSLADQLRFFYDDPDQIWQQNKGGLVGASARQAAGLVSRFQERPADQAGNIQARGNLAEEILAEYRGARGPGQQFRDQQVQNADDAAANLSVANSNDQEAARRAGDARARALAGRPGDAARARISVDPTVNPILGENQANQQLNSVLDSQRDQAAQQSAETRQQTQDQLATAKAYDESRAAVDKLKISQQLDREERTLGTGILDRQQRALELNSGEVANTAEQMGQQALKARESTEDNIRLSAAWEKGAGAAAAMARTLELAPFEREIASLKERGVNVDALVAKYNKLVAVKNADARASQDAAASQRITQTRDQDKISAIDLDPFASDQTLARRRAVAQTEQYIKSQDQLSAGKANDLRAQTLSSQDLKEQISDVQSYRNAWKEAQDATFSALNSIIINGGSAKDVLGSLSRSLANILLQIAETPLKNAAGNWLSGLLGFGGASAGGITAATGTSSLAGGSAIGIGELYAMGGAFMGGARMMAQGDVLDRRTTMMTQGGPVVAGEMGDEALLPLKRMPDGNLGVATGGGRGGSGSSITVNAPITVQGGAVGANGQMDAASQANLQRQLEETVRVAVVAGIANEKRPGGSLYG